MTRLRKLLSLLSGLVLVLGSQGAWAQTPPEEEEEDADLTAEAEVSTDDLWGDEEEEGDAEEEPTEEEEAAPASAPWSASLDYGHDALLRPFLVTGESADPTYNPSYSHSLSISPGWKFDDHWSLGAEVGFSQELTNPDDRTGRYDVWVSNSETLSYAKIVELYDFALGASLRTSFPTTPVQQTQTLYFSVGPGFSIARPFDVLKGLKLTYGFRFTKNFHRYAEASSPPQPIGCENAEDQSDCTTTSQGNRNTNFSLGNSLSASLGITEAFTVGLSTGVSHAKAYSLTPATLGDALTGTHNGVENPDQSISESDAQGGWRFAYSFGVSADYTINDYLTASAGVGMNNSPQLDPSSQLYNPFLPNRNTTAGLSISLSLDQFVQHVGPTRASRSSTRVANRSSESQ